MAAYVKSVDFAAKDGLSPGDPAKVVKGTEINTEFTNIATAIGTKADSSAVPTNAQAILQSIIDAAGDLIVGTAADASGRLAMGAALALLRTNAAGTALEWGTAGQIVFPATQAASANVNTLDDYEEGSWTPTITLGGAAVGLTYGAQLGRYTKIGNKVTCFFDVTLTALGSSTGAVVLNGFPFVAADLALGMKIVSTDVCWSAFAAATFSNLVISMRTADGISAALSGTGGGTTALDALAITQANLTSTTRLSGNITYRT